METVLVSACLLGIRCRYDGRSARTRRLNAILRTNHVVFACPEQLGGLTTPRPKNHIIGKKVINELNDDVTENFYKGAREFIRIARMFEVKTLYLKSRSPSCGQRGIVRQLLPKTIKTNFL